MRLRKWKGRNHSRYGAMKSFVGGASPSLYHPYNVIAYTE